MSFTPPIPVERPVERLQFYLVYQPEGRHVYYDLKSRTQFVQPDSTRSACVNVLNSVITVLSSEGDGWTREIIGIPDSGDALLYRTSDGDWCSSDPFQLPSAKPAYGRIELLEDQLMQLLISKLRLEYADRLYYLIRQEQFLHSMLQMSDTKAVPSYPFRKPVLKDRTVRNLQMKSEGASLNDEGEAFSEELHARSKRGKAASKKDLHKSDSSTKLESKNKRFESVTDIEGVVLNGLNKFMELEGSIKEEISSEQQEVLEVLKKESQAFAIKKYGICEDILSINDLVTCFFGSTKRNESILQIADRLEREHEIQKKLDLYKMVVSIHECMENIASHQPFDRPNASTLNTVIVLQNMMEQELWKLAEMKAEKKSKSARKQAKHAKRAKRKLKKTRRKKKSKVRYVDSSSVTDDEESSSLEEYTEASESTSDESADDDFGVKTRRKHSKTSRKHKGRKHHW